MCSDFIHWFYFCLLLIGIQGCEADKTILAFSWQNPTKWHGRQAKTQISLGIRPVWSESSLSAWRKLGSLAIRWAHSEDWSDWRMPRLIWVFAGHTGHFVGFVMRQLISLFLCMLTVVNSSKLDMSFCTLGLGHNSALVPYVIVLRA